MDINMNHVAFLQTVADNDVKELERKEATYKGSWRRNGGVHAWHMLQRKIDRLLVMLAPLSEADKSRMLELATVLKTSGHLPMLELAGLLERAVMAEDIFAAMAADTSGADGSVLAEVRDMRRYLLLFEAKLMADTTPRRKPTVRELEEILREPSGPVTVQEDGSVIAESLIGKTVSWNMGGELLGTIIEVERSAGRDFVIVQPVDTTDPAVQWKLDATAVRLYSGVIKPAPVPAEDSNKHAPRAGHEEGTQQRADMRAFREDGSPRPLISAELHATLSPAVQEQWIVSGKHAWMNRNRLMPEIVEAMSHYPLTCTKGHYEGYPASVKELYEPRSGVENEYQLREIFREHWGR